MKVTGIIFFAIGIIILIWIFFIREPKKKNDLQAEGNSRKDNKNEKDTPLIDDSADELPDGYIEGLKGILGPDMEDDNIRLVWDTFIDRPMDADYYILIAGRLMALKKHEKAKTYLARAVSVLPPNAELSENLGDVCLKLGDMEGAIDAYNKALELDSEKTKPMINLATVYISRDDFESSKEILLKVLDKEPDNKRARLFYGQVLYELKELEEAYCQLNKVYKADQRIPQTHYFIGMVLIELGEVAVGAKALRKYLELQPEGIYKMDADRVLNGLPENTTEDQNDTGSDSSNEENA